MKKVFVGIVSVLVLVLIISPFIIGDVEVDELNNETRYRLEGQFIQLSDGVVHYELKGPTDAQVVVLVHGNAAPYFSWDYNVEALLKASFRVLRYDIYGHGFSDRPKLKKYNRNLYDRQIVELLKALKVNKPVHIIGTSQGGSIATYFTAIHPEKVKKLALLSPLFDSFEGEGMVRLLITPGIGEYFMKVFGDKSATDPSKVLASTNKIPELTEKLKQQIRFKGKKRAILANMRGDALENNTDYYEKVRDQNRPILLTWGNKDKSISGESMKRLRELIPSIEYHELTDVGHLAHYERPEEINPILIEFLKQ